MATTQRNIDALAAPLDDATRDACLHQLGTLYDAGAMSMEELDMRICAALAAQTEEELVDLLRDLTESQEQLESPPVAKREPVTPADSAPPSRPAARPTSRSTTRQAGRLARPVVLVGAGTAVVVAAAVVLGSVLPIVVYVSALVGSVVLRTAGGRPTEDPTTVDVADEPTAVQTQPSQDLALLPRAAVPAQRMPGKVHPVIVPNDDRLGVNDQDAGIDEPDVAPQKLIVPSVRELPSAERLAVGPSRPAAPESDDRCELPAQVDDAVAEDRHQDVAWHIRPLLDRVSDGGWLPRQVRRSQSASRVRSS